MAIVDETLHLSGIKCERCVTRLTLVLKDHPGLEYANVNLMGGLQLSYDDQLTTREALLEAIARGGFHPLPGL